MYATSVRPCGHDHAFGFCTIKGTCVPVRKARPALDCSCCGQHGGGRSVYSRGRIERYAAAGAGHIKVVAGVCPG